MKQESIEREKRKCVEILNLKDLGYFEKESIDKYFISLIEEEIGGKNAIFQKTSRI